MALKEIPGDIQGAKGTVETIQIVPGQRGTVVTIASVLYGSDANGPSAVAINPDKTSFNLTVLPGSNLLQVTLFSPNQIDGTAIAQQILNGATTVLEDDIEFVGGVAVWSPEILGV